MAAATVPFGFRALPLTISQLSLAATLKCGQSFRWTSYPLFPKDLPISAPIDQPTYEYRYCLQDRIICLRQSIDNLFYRAIYSSDTSRLDSSLPLLKSKPNEIEERRERETLNFIHDYFQLDTDLMKLYDEWSDRDIVFRNLRHRFSGIRMLRQDPWENIVSFICSSNNNISRITKMVQSLCVNFSSAVVQHTQPSTTSQQPLTSSYHPFPPPSALADPSVGPILRKLGFGYRAEYIQKTASMLIEEHGSDGGVFKWLEGLRTKETKEVREELVKLCGVGRKVADCILLMSLDKREVIPIDTHVYQIAIKHYGFRSSSSLGKGGKVNMTPKLYDEMNEKLTKIWGSYAGWAHSVLFTADLKYFSTYGLMTPSPSVSPQRPNLLSPPSSEEIAAMSPSPSPTKRRKRKPEPEIDMLQEALEKQIDTPISEASSMVDRVKRRISRISNNL